MKERDRGCEILCLKETGLVGSWSVLSVRMKTNGTDRVEQGLGGVSSEMTEEDGTTDGSTKVHPGTHCTVRGRRTLDLIRYKSYRQ